LGSVRRVARVEPLTTARALRGPFDYAVGPEVDVGSLLVVPFGRQELTGVVTEIVDHSEHELSEPRRVLEDTVPAPLVALGLWLAEEYCSTPARALQLMLPPTGARAKTALWAQAARAPEEGERLTDGQRALLVDLPRATGDQLPALRRLEARGLVEIGPRPVRRAPVHVAVGSSGRGIPDLTADQEAALAEIEASPRGDRLLLHGVTGSGKTEVYLRAAADVLERGESVLVLVPEIALTPQIVSRFAERFGDTVAVLHSGLGAGERYDEWRRLRSGEARICVGPRSAVFAPMERVGLVIVDEEHDPTYKNEGDPRYDARRVALRRAMDAGALLLAGSATPRPEAIQSLRRLVLPERVDGQPMPPVELVDMRAAERALHPRTAQALADASKSIVLLNRRGWSNFLTCRTCAHVWMCPDCDVSLVLHRAGEFLACHHCGHRERVPQVCPECASVSIVRHGTGTERLASELEALHPIVFRLDADTANAGETLAAFQAADRGVLVGTQVVAKGHDFPDVELGVVVDADATLRFPDFRAEERTFALVTQLAGRAGRGGAHGHVMVQTIDPRARSLQFAARHDSDGFVTSELARRRALRYPPFSTLIRIVCGAPDRADAHAAAMAIRAQLGPEAMGPADLFRLRGRERSQVVVKAAHRRPAVAAVRAAVDGVARDRAHRGVAISVDVDPQ
jgi:primosomal protein N' (replication factor Y)